MYVALVGGRIYRWDKAGGRREEGFSPICFSLHSWVYLCLPTYAHQYLHVPLEASEFQRYFFMQRSLGVKLQL